jgi:uncharacterized coiled-coil protein SlyX
MATKQTTIQGQDLAKSLLERDATISKLESKLSALKNRIKESETAEQAGKFDALTYCAGPNPGNDLNSAVKARFDRLCATLRRYGVHEKGCKWPMIDCTCGLAEVFNDYSIKIAEE